MEFKIRFSMYEDTAKANNIRPQSIVECINRRFFAGIAATMDKEINEITAEDVNSFLNQIVVQDGDEDNLGPDVLIGTIKNIKYDLTISNAVNRCVNFKLDFYEPYVERICKIC